MAVVVALIALTSLLSGCHGTETKYRVECSAWDNVTTYLNNDYHTTEHCKKNLQCTGFDCSGIYQYRGMYSGYQAVELKYCFGMAIHPCKKPVNLHLYIDIPAQDIHFQKNVDNSNDLRITGLSFPTTDSRQLDGFVHVGINRTSTRGHPYVIVKMTLKVRLQGKTGAGEWPPGMQRELMPETHIPVPPCEQDVLTPTHLPATCHPYVTSTTGFKPSTTTVPNIPGSNSPIPKTTITMHPIKGPDSKYKKTCIENKAYECGNNMMCKESVCKCSPGFRHIRGKCVPKETPEATTPLIIDYHTDVIVSTKNKTPLIIGVSVGAIVLVMAIIGVILFIKFRKHQLRYGNHQLLVNNEEEEDDDPIDVST